MYPQSRCQHETLGRPSASLSSGLPGSVSPASDTGQIAESGVPTLEARKKKTGYRIDSDGMLKYCKKSLLCSLSKLKEQ